MKIIRELGTTFLIIGTAIGSAASAMADRPMNDLAPESTRYASQLGPVNVPSPLQPSPRCAKWTFGAVNVTFSQGNGWDLHLRTDTGVAAASGPRGGRMNGTYSGGVEGNRVNFTVRWDGGSVGKYEGWVREDGIASGGTHDETHPGPGTAWTSGHKFRCNDWER
jgi:hypothetical protein